MNQAPTEAATAPASDRAPYERMTGAYLLTGTLHAALGDAQIYAHAGRPEEADAAVPHERDIARTAVVEVISTMYGLDSVTACLYLGRRILEAVRDEAQFDTRFAQLRDAIANEAVSLLIGIRPTATSFEASVEDLLRELFDGTALVDLLEEQLAAGGIDAPDPENQEVP